MGGLNTIPRLMRLTSKSANYTAVNGDLVVCDASGGSFTVTLPTTPDSIRPIGIKAANVGSGSNTVAIGRNSKTIYGASADIVLYVAGDYVEVWYDGTGWQIVSDKRVRHSGLTRRDTAQTLATGTQTKITSQTAVTDVGGITDAANDRYVIRRAGSYLIGPSVAFVSAIGDGQNASMNVFVNGSSIISFNAYSSAAAATIRLRGTWVLTLAAGDTVEMYCAQNSGGNLDTSTSDQNKPQLFVQEQ